MNSTETITCELSLVDAAGEVLKISMPVLSLGTLSVKFLGLDVDMLVGCLDSLFLQRLGDGTNAYRIRRLSLRSGDRHWARQMDQNAVFASGFSDQDLPILQAAEHPVIMLMFAVLPQYKRNHAAVAGVYRNMTLVTS